jgi:hypothetical protein
MLRRAAGEEKALDPLIHLPLPIFWLQHAALVLWKAAPHQSALAAGRLWKLARLRCSGPAIIGAPEGMEQHKAITSACRKAPQVGHFGCPRCMDWVVFVRCGDVSPGHRFDPVSDMQRAGYAAISTFAELSEVKQSGKDSRHRGYFRVISGPRIALSNWAAATATFVRSRPRSVTLLMQE